MAQQVFPSGFGGEAASPKLATTRIRCGVRGTVISNGEVSLRNEDSPKSRGVQLKHRAIDWASCSPFNMESESGIMIVLAGEETTCRPR